VQTKRNVMRRIWLEHYCFIDGFLILASLGKVEM
jgi:hypothetical protein